MIIWYRFLTSNTLSFLRFESFLNKLLCCLFGKLESFPKFCGHWVISIRLRSLKDHSFSIPSLVIHDQPDCDFFMRRVPGLWIFCCSHTVTPLSLLSWYKVSFPVCSFKFSSFPSFVLKSRKRIFVWNVGKWANTCSGFS